jgi:hypothetical protein
MELTVCRHLPPTSPQPIAHSSTAKSVKKRSSVAAFFPILADFCQEKRKKVTRSDRFKGALSFINLQAFS